MLQMYKVCSVSNQHKTHFYFIYKHKVLLFYIELHISRIILTLVKDYFTTVLSSKFFHQTIPPVWVPDCQLIRWRYFRDIRRFFPYPLDTIQSNRRGPCHTPPILNSLLRFNHSEHTVEKKKENNYIGGGGGWVLDANHRISNHPPFFL